MNYLTKKLAFALLGSLLINCSLNAADDMTLTAKRGGIIKMTKNAYLEVVHEKEQTKIYVTGRDYRNIADEKLTLSAIAYVDGKKYPMQLTFKNDHYSASPGNTYLQKEKNFVLMLTISLPGSVDTASFNLENR